MAKREDTTNSSQLYSNNIMTCLDRLPALVSTLLLICSVESSSDHVVVSRNVIEEASSYSTLTKESRIIGGWEVSLCN
jgi:hypothetical protein